MAKAPNFIALELPYNGVLMLPAAMAEAIVNNAIIIEKKYTDGVYTYSLHDREQINLTKPELLAVVTNTPEAPSWGLGKGQIAKVKKILEWIFQSVKKPD